MSDETIARVLVMRRERASCREIATALSYPRNSIVVILKQYAPELLNIGLKHGPHSARPAQAASLQAQGIIWREITDRLGYSDEGCAIRAVRRYTGRPALQRGWPQRVSA